jgi:hypothetical protein
MVKTYSETLKSLGVSHFDELTENQKEIIKQAYPQEIKYGEDAAKKFREAEDAEHKRKKDEENRLHEQERQDRKLELEMGSAITVAHRIRTEMGKELLEFCKKYREQLVTSKELSLEVNKKLVLCMVKAFANDSSASDEITAIIKSAYKNYEFAKYYGLL